MALTTATWVPNTSGSWTTPADWSGGLVPGQGSNTGIAALFAGGTASYTVNVASGTTLSVGTTSTATGTDVALQVDDQFITLDDSGTITAGTAGHAITELNAGTIDVLSSGLLAVGNTYTQTGGTLNVASSGSVTVAKNGGVSVALSGGAIDINGGTFTTTGNLNESSGVIDVSSGIINVATTAAVNQTGGSILVGDGTLETGTLTQSSSTIGFNAAGGLLQFAIGGSSVNVNMGAVGVADTVNLTSTHNISELTLSNFFTGDALNVTTGGPLSNGSLAYSGTDTAATLTITGTVAGTAISDVVHITTPGATHPTSSKFVLSSNATSFTVTSNVVCYMRGTHILTATGERRIEHLVEGDMVVTLAGGVLAEHPIRWLGRRFIDLTTHPRPETVAPIRIQRSAVAADVPHTDLLVSPNHAIFVDGMLICARQLLNGTTIRQEMNWPSVDYLHIELDAHAILLAEGLPAESYLDTGNRRFFTNSGEPLLLHPDLTVETNKPTREAHSCEPFVSDEINVRPVWDRLARRAATLGQPPLRRDAIADPGLRIIANNRSVLPISVISDRYIFVLPQGVTQVRLTSSSGAPTDARPWLTDDRCLGVCVHRIVLHTAQGPLEVPLDHPNLLEGWWSVEWDGTAVSRWTNGDAALQLAQTVGPTMLELRASIGGMTYAADPAWQTRAA